MAFGYVESTSASVRLGEHVLPAHVVVDDRARRLALAEAGDADLLADGCVRLLDGGVDLGGGYGDGQLDVVAFERLNAGSQHRRSFPCMT